VTAQPHPNVTRADVGRGVRRDFPSDQIGKVMAMLGEYGTESWHSEPDRVRLAALKLAAGSLERLRYEIEGAKCDYRDVVGPAEVPGYCRRGSRVKGLSPGEKQRIIDADWKQYQDRLTR